MRKFRRTLTQRKNEFLASLESSAKETRGGDELNVVIEEAKVELSKEWKYKIQRSKGSKDIADSYELKVSFCRAKKETDFNCENDAEATVNKMKEHLNKNSGVCCCCTRKAC